MADHLVFTLVAPIGSFGGPAGHERRGGGLWPGRGALLGLLGAALGVRRADVAEQRALNDWRIAVSVLSETRGFQDFHTVETVPSARIKRPDTRRAALAALTPSDNPVITRRDYRADCAFGVAMWGGDCAAGAEALRRPVFTLSLGRKSCPLSAPTGAAVVAAEDPMTALAAAPAPGFMALDPTRPRLVVSDEEIAPGWRETAWDAPLDRGVWHFGPRRVFLHAPGDGP